MLVLSDTMAATYWLDTFSPDSETSRIYYMIYNTKAPLVDFVDCSWYLHLVPLLSALVVQTVGSFEIVSN